MKNSKLERFKAPHAIIRQIVGRCHVARSHLSVCRYVISRMKRGRWAKLARPSKRKILAEAIRVHARNRDVYAQVMAGNGATRWYGRGVF